MTVTLSLPIPPSVNHLYRVRDGKPRKSDRYKTWARAAHGEFLAQHGHLMPKIRGKFSAVVTLDEARRGNSDADNRVKALLDFLQAPAVGVIGNDKDCESITIQWGAAPAGCTVVLSPASDLQKGRAA